jgi:hypothetical protein
MSNHYFVKTGDKFGIKGWWININKIAPFEDHCDFISDPEEIVGGGEGSRSIWVYFGLERPSFTEVEKFLEIEGNPPIFN